MTTGWTAQTLSEGLNLVHYNKSCKTAVVVLVEGGVIVSVGADDGE